MTTTQLQPRAQAQLTEMREQLLARIEQQRGGKVSRADAAYAHFDHVQDDDGQRNNERDVEFAINENETEKLQDIELALQRIADQSYGLCINCGERIHDKRLEAAPLPLDEVVEIGSRVATALHELHRQHLVHLDVKPENLLYATSAADSDLKIMDYGHGLLFPQPPIYPSIDRGRYGTPGYIPPEALLRSENCSPQP